MNILELASAFPYPNGVIPASIGGTGDKKIIAKMLARQSNFENTPVRPSVYAYPPTMATSASPSITTAPLIGWDGTQMMWSTTGNWATAGTNIIPMGSTYTPMLNIGMKARHIMDATPVIPDGTVVTAIDTVAGNVTLSKNLTGNMPGSSYVGFGDSVVSFIGISGQASYRGGYPYMKNASNADWTEQPFAVEFDHYGSAINVLFSDNNAYTTFWVWVDGQPVTSAPTMPAGFTPGSQGRGWLNITFDNAGDNVARWRRIRIYLLNARFGGMRAGMTDTVASTRLKYPKIAWLGDSWTEGVVGTGFGTSTLEGTPYKATELLGLGLPIMAGQGSTGYVSVGAYGNVTNFGNATRVAPIVAADPDALVIWGSINDAAYTDAQVQNAAYTLYTTFQQQIPRTKLLVVGVQARGGFTSATDRSHNLALKAAAAAANVPFLSPVEEGWIEGSGKYGATTGAGNADIMMGSDGAHLQQAGWDYYARRIAAWIADQL